MHASLRSDRKVFSTQNGMKEKKKGQDIFPTASGKLAEELRM